MDLKYTTVEIEHTRRTSFFKCAAVLRLFEVQNMLSPLRDILSWLLSSAIWKGGSGAKMKVLLSNTHSVKRVPTSAYYPGITRPEIGCRRQDLLTGALCRKEDLSGKWYHWVRLAHNLSRCVLQKHLITNSILSPDPTVTPDKPHVLRWTFISTWQLLKKHCFI